MEKFNTGFDNLTPWIGVSILCQRGKLKDLSFVAWGIKLWYMYINSYGSNILFIKQTAIVYRIMGSMQIESPPWTMLLEKAKLKYTTWTLLSRKQKENKENRYRAETHTEQTDQAKGNAAEREMSYNTHEIIIFDVQIPCARHYPFSTLG